jgi:predicted RNA-binding Zn-ribbon protein involved in translation (DUF1610 family)
MASRKSHSPRSPASAARALVYVACPDCGRAVRLSDDNRVSNKADAYECPNCGARFVFSAKTG